MTLYHGNWHSQEEMAQDFSSSWNGEPLHKAMTVDVVFAAYETPGYEGEAIVLYREGGKLFEVHGSHCSCYGLEGQWEPEEVDPDVLLQRVEKAGVYGVEASFKEEIKAALSTPLPPRQ